MDYIINSIIVGGLLGVTIAVVEQITILIKKK
jgi:hypothetical protein